MNIPWAMTSQANAACSIHIALQLSLLRRGSLVLIETFSAWVESAEKVTTDEYRTGGQRAEPLPDFCRFLEHPYRFLVHRT